MSNRFVFHRGAVPAGHKEAYPHLVCSWWLDPISQRLSCAWAPPAPTLDQALLPLKQARRTVAIAVRKPV